MEFLPKPEGKWRTVRDPRVGGGAMRRAHGVRCGTGIFSNRPAFTGYLCVGSPFVFLGTIGDDTAYINSYISYFVLSLTSSAFFANPKKQRPIVY